MMYLCPHQNATSYETSICKADLTSCITHLGFIVISSLLLLLYGCCPPLRRNKTPYTLHYTFHNARWILLLTLIFFMIFAILDGVLSDFKSTAPQSQPHLYLPSTCACVAAILACMYYHHMEAWLRPGFIWLLVAYWVLALIGECLRLARWIKEPDNVDLRIVRFSAIVFAMSLYAVLGLLELCTVVKTVLGQSNEMTDDLPLDLRNTSMKYYLRYVSLPSKVVFSWELWLLRLGYKKPLEMSDLGELPKMSASHYNEFVLERCIKEEKERAMRKGGLKHFSVYRIILKAYFSWHLTAVLIKIVADVSNFIIPLTVGAIIKYATVLYYDKGQMTDQYSEFVTFEEFFSNGFVLLVIMTLAGIIRNVLLQNFYYCTIMSGILLQAGMQAAIYNKSLRLSGWTMTSGAMTTGQITNFISVDIQNMMNFFEFCHYVYSIPLMITVFLVMLYNILGVAPLIASMCFILAVPIQYQLAKLQARLQKSALQISDERLKQTREMLQGMKLIKLYGWEKTFCDVITSVRNREIKKLMSAVVFLSVAVFTSYSIPAIFILLTFVLFSALSGLPLTPAIAFTTLTIVDQLRFPVKMLADLIQYIITNHVSIKRLNAFFIAKEIEREFQDHTGIIQDEAHGQEARNRSMAPEAERHVRKPPKSYAGRFIGRLFFSSNASKSRKGKAVPCNDYMQLALGPDDDETQFGVTQPDLPDDVAIKVQNGNFSWVPYSSSSCLCDINVEIPKGSLTMIFGQVGMGKSSLLSAILGEMHTVSGAVQINREHTGFAYCSQRAWLINASLKDNILFGQEFEEEKFEAVVSACSLQPDIDILPAGELTEIGEKGTNLSGGQKQRVSVARAMYSLNDIVILDDPLSALDVHVGSHLFQEGIIRQLLGRKRTVVLVTHQLRYLKYANKVLVMKDGRINLQGTPSYVSAADPDLTSILVADRVSIKSQDVFCVDEVEKEQHKLQKLVKKRQTKEREGILSEEEGRLIEKEERKTGTISWKVIVFYLQAMRYPQACLVLIVILMQHSLIIARDFWLSKWSEARKRLELANATEEEMHESELYYIYSYSSMTVSSATLSFIATLALFLSGIVAAKHLHRRMLAVVSKAPMRFFDTTLVGRILNRFSSDTYAVDSLLMNKVMLTSEAAFDLLAAVLVNSIVSPLFILVFVPVAVCFFIIHRFFITSSRELQRLDSITKSPIYAHFSESLNGLSTIRAYRVERRFKELLLDAIDRNTLASLHLNTCNRWLGVFLDLIGYLCVFLAVLMSLLVAVTSPLEPSYVGLALAYTVAGSTNLNWFIRHLCVLEMQMNAVERIKYYSNIVTENYEGTAPDSGWPQHGAVTVEDVSVRYAETLDPVLRNISLNVKPGQKIGICGRTGSGKSSLTLALFRIVDMFKGRIMIDNVDIATLPLDFLRQRLSIIPQDPILFSGTIRFNLDPLGKCSEEDLWTSLEIAQLKATVTGLEAGLDYCVSEGGDNFSMGQRQLFCLARAFLRKSRILILDEATASIDIETDNIVQRVLTEEFSNRTILVIAHRVTTILDADTILVLNDGDIVECDTPQNLLVKEGGLFASFVDSAQR